MTTPSSSDTAQRQSAPVSQVIVFDLDDTLYLERDYVRSGLDAVGVWARGCLGLPDLARAMQAHFENGARTNIFDKALVDIGADVSPALIARMLAVYRQHRPRIALADDSRRFLARRGHDVGLALITDGYLDAQRRKVRALGLHRHGFRLAICTDRWGRESWKPHPRAFEHVQQAFGVAAGRMTYVADNPSKDFRAPRDLGWRTIRIARAGGLYADLDADAYVGGAADRTISDLDELE